MSEWRAWHLYYGDLNRLLLECVHPFLERHAGEVDTWFWQRHYAGGPHLRVRLKGAPWMLAAAGAGLVREAEAFMAANPSEDVAYAPERAAKLMEMEGETPADGELAYRNNAVEEAPYRRDAHGLASEEALGMAEDFRRDSAGVVVDALRGPVPLREQLLRLYFAQFLAVGGSLPAGAVASKSHWEGFAATFASAEAVERIRATYERERETIHRSLLHVASWWNGEADDALLTRWAALLAAYDARAGAVIRGGTHLTKQITTLDELEHAREVAGRSIQRDSDFLSALYGDRHFLAAIQFEPAFLVPRVLVNLLYMLVAAAGVSPVEKMALCHFASRAVEEHFGCDLTELLRENMRRVSGAHAQRLAGAA
jgi:Lantibiotic biosynthesis dehydratase C-term